MSDNETPDDGEHPSLPEPHGTSDGWHVLIIDGHEEDPEVTGRSLTGGVPEGIAMSASPTTAKSCSTRTPRGAAWTASTAGSDCGTAGARMPEPTRLVAPHGVIARLFARFRRPQPRPLYVQRSHVRLIRDETGR